MPTGGLPLSPPTFCSLIFKEMDRYLQYNKGSKGIRKKLKCSKPFWNDKLTCNWKIMRDNEEEKWRKFQL